MTSVLEAFAASYYSALHTDLDNVMEEQYQYEQSTGAPGRVRVSTGEYRPRRPRPRECTLLAAFEQTWPNTACGFSGLAGQAFTNALTVAIQGPNEEVCVYFGGRFAYRLGRQNAQFASDLANRSLAEQSQALIYRD